MANIPFLNNAYFSAKVGIGVENPSKELEVAGSAEVVGTLYVEAANNQIRLLDTNDSTVNFSVGANGTFQIRDVNAATTPFSIQQGALQNSLVIKADGDVGINTSGPDTKLHVVGDSTLATQGTVLKVENTSDTGSSQDIHIYNQYDRDIGIKFETLGGTNYIWQDSNSDDALIFTAGGNARATDSTLILEQNHDASFPLGMLGVGLTNPAVTLHVNGFARFNGGLQLDGNSRKILAIDDTDLGLGTNNIERINISSTGAIQFNEYGAGTLVTDASGNITAEGGAWDGPFLPLAGGTMTGTITMSNNRITSIEELRFNNGGNIDNQINTDVDTGTETVANVAIATYTAAFFDFVIKKTTNVRSGTVYACHDGTNVEFTETSTNDLGDTSDVTLSVDISGTNMRLLATVTSDDWSVKSLIRAI